MTLAEFVKISSSFKIKRDSKLWFLSFCGKYVVLSNNALIFLNNNYLDVVFLFFITLNIFIFTSFLVGLVLLCIVGTSKFQFVYT